MDTYTPTALYIQVHLAIFINTPKIHDVIPYLISYDNDFVGSTAVVIFAIAVISL